MSNLGPNTGMGDKTDRGRNSDIYGNYFSEEDKYLKLFILAVSAV